VFSVVKNVFLNPAGRWQKIAVVLFHLLALTLTARLAHWPYLLVALTLVAVNLPFTLYTALCPPPSSLLALPSSLTTLRPLFILYTITALRLALALIARALCPACSASLAVPEPFASWLSFEWAAVFSLVAVIVLRVAQTFPASHHARLAGFSLAVLALLWISLLFPRLVPAGVTGADPFAYVQMSVDLATRGTPAHRFPLAGLAHNLNIPVYPTLFVGYTIPQDGEAATVWPPGFSALLALAFKLFGEGGLYWLNPLIACLCLIATFLLARHVFNLPSLFSLLSSLLLLTSLEQTVRLAVPLADLAVQLFTTLAIIIAFGIWKLEVGSWKLEVGSLVLGIFSGLAFVTRYTQLLLLPGLFITYYYAPRTTRYSPRSFIIHCSLFIVSFFLTALPDFYYRTLAFGSPISFAAGELAQFSAAEVLPVASRLLGELAADFNLALPFIIVGLVHLFRFHRRTALGLLLILGPVTLFHLPYHYLKLRDLLFLFPALCALAAFGFQLLITNYFSHLSFGVLRFTIICILFIIFAFRWNSQRPFLSGFYTYGFLTSEGRANIDAIANLTEPDAVIAGSLNTGAVSLYSRRDTVRPGRLLQPGRTWTDQEFVQFAAALHKAGRPLYVLMDSEEMIDPAKALESCCRLIPIAELYLPYYYQSGAASHELVRFYRLDFK
jgi:hypothetical protein